MAGVKTLYDEDFVAWSKQQAEALRSAARGGSNQTLDWENLAEEINSLGISERRELHSQIQRVVHHLLKLEFSRASLPREGWIDSIHDGRTHIELLLEASPSLRAELAAAVARGMKHGARKAVRDLREHSGLDPDRRARIDAAAYTQDQILGDWFPDEPSRAA